MITNVQTLSTTPQPAICPKPMNPTPAPAPADTVDFSKIDTAAKAAALPAMDPAVQLGVAAAVVAMIFAGMGGGAPLVTLDLTTRTNGVESQATYTLDAKSEDAPVRVDGEFAGQPLTGGLLIDEEKEQIGWAGTIGQNAEEIRFTGADEEGEKIHLSVKFGDVAGELDMSPIKGDKGEDDYRGYLIEGTLGGQPYRLENTLEIPEELKNGGGDEGKIELPMHSKGTVGDQEISKEYNIVAQQTGSGATATVTGSGTVAGIQQEIEAILTVAA